MAPLNDLRPLKPSRASVIGNLPYYITSDILLHLFEFHDQFDAMVIMVQREVGGQNCCHAGLPRLWPALRHRTTLLPSGQPFHAAPGRIYAAAQSSFQRAKADRGSPFS